MTAAAPESALAASVKFACYFSLPLYIALITCMLISTYAYIRAIASGLSPYPRWCWVFSIPVGTLLISLVSFFGNHAIVNAIMLGSLTFGNIWKMSGALLMLDRARENREKAAV